MVMCTDSVNRPSSHSPILSGSVMLYFATSILVRTRIVQFWYVPELFITCSNSRTCRNCAIPEHTSIFRLYNSGTRFLPELLLQFWDVPELSVNYFPIAC